MIEGACACGRIQYCIDAEKPRSTSACYCGTCQKVSGGPFLGFAQFDLDRVRWNEQPDVWVSSDFAKRGHCKVCGSALYMTYEFEKGSIWLTLGTIKNPPISRVSSHIFVAEKAPWFVLSDDGVVRHDEFGPDGQRKLHKWKQGMTRSKL